GVRQGFSERMERETHDFAQASRRVGEGKGGPHVMEHRILGRTGLEVTRLGFGAMEIRGKRIWGGRPVTDEQAERILNAVLDAGINFIDTAYDYGLSEAYIGRFISHRRDEYYLATKCGCTVVDAGDHDETPHIWTRDN